MYIYACAYIYRERERERERCAYIHIATSCRAPPRSVAKRLFMASRGPRDMIP